LAGKTFIHLFNKSNSALLWPDQKSPICGREQTHQCTRHAVFLALNGIELQYPKTELSDIILQLAASTIQASDLLNWISTHQI